MKFDVCESCGTRLMPELMVCPHCNEPADHPIPTDLRCECGFLLCKLAEDSIEIKCRRCKRLVELPVEALPERFEKRKEETRAARLQGHRGQPGDPRGQLCTSCGQIKQYVVYGKCIDCRTESIKVQYKSKTR